MTKEPSPEAPVATRGRQYWGRALWRRKLLFDFAALGVAVPHFIFVF